MEQDFWDSLRAPGIPSRINTEAYGSLQEIFQQAFQKHGNRPAFTGMGHTLTYHQIDQLSDYFCRYLQHQTDLKPGDRIAIQMANLLQYPVVIYGAVKAGLVIVNTNPLYTPREMQHQFNDAGVRALVFMNTVGDKVQKVLAHTSVDYVIGTDVADLLPTPKRVFFNAMAKYVKKIVPAFTISGQISLRQALGKGRYSAPARLVASKPGDTAVLQYTGGTTGVAKGAVLSHGNLVANMMQINAVLQQQDSQGIPMYNTGEEVVVAPLPLYHIYAFTMHLMSAVHSGQHNILIANPRDTDLFIHALKPWKMTVFFGLNTLFVSLLNNPRVKEIDFSHLKTTNSGGTALASDTNSRWQELTGCGISEGYGLTECSPVVCVSGGGDYINEGSVGLPVPNTSLKVINQQGEELAIGEKGELCVKGPQVMQGYWQKPEATIEVLDDQGWFHTGDIAVINSNGVVHIVDRVKDMVIVSGFNVYPNEIEDVVMAHPDVEYAAAIGIQDNKTGEAVKLFVVPASPKLNKDVLMEYCREHLTGYKIPKIIEFKDSLPMSPVGKILRKELRE